MLFSAETDQSALTGVSAFWFR